MAEPLDDLLGKMVEVGASDLPLEVGSPPVTRIDGDLHPTNLHVLTPQDTDTYAEGIFTQKGAKEFRDQGEADFAYGKSELGRFRVDVFRQRGSVGLVLRRVESVMTSFHDLGLPPVLEKLSMEQRGLILVTGPTGSGKTTSLAAMIGYINTYRAVNVVTIEDPIEVLHTDKKAIVSQREIGMDTQSFDEALKRVLRQDPDAVLLGEMRDAETVRAAIQAAETGHLVRSTLHMTDATETINRIIDFFPPYQQKQIRLQLAGSLKGIVSQRLMEKTDGEGRVPAVETLTMNGRVFDRIVDETAAHTLEDVIKESGFYGMQTFDQAILKLFKAGHISFQTALAAASNPHDLRVKAEQAGLVAV
jgi:twitching motility protein PilT